MCEVEWETLKWVDLYNNRHLLAPKAHVTLEIVRRMPWMKGFVVIRRPLSWFASKPREGSGWVVERKLAWIMKCRRLARNYEQLASVVEAFITIAAAATLLRRWP